jgi:hypothetical protein
MFNTLWWPEGGGRKARRKNSCERFHRMQVIGTLGDHG